MAVSALLEAPAGESADAAPVSRRSITLGGTSYPVVLPKVRDARLHVAVVVITLHVLGQVGLRFQVSVPQILAAVLTSALISVVLTFVRTRAFVWPASAMLTGSGIGLILRVPGTSADDHWSTDKWWVFAGVAAFGLLTKEVIRYRGAHLFNPSNIALVVVFVVFGSTRLEPLDFWWAPLNGWMIAAYAVILVGGLAINTRLHFLPSMVTYWLGLATGLGVLAASGHCMTARWAFAPVCGFEFWWAVMTSPELLIFLFFMLTDPKTVPTGRVGRVVFGVVVAVTSTLLMAPQTTEFATKVALLGSLVIACALRPLLDRLVPAAGSADDTLGAFAKRLLGIGAGAGRAAVRAAVAAVAVLGLGVGVVAAGGPARGEVATDPSDILGRVPHDVDPATFPAIVIDQGVLDWNHEIAGPGARAIVLTLVENLELENQALRRADATILEAVDHGDRLDEMQARLNAAVANGTTVIQRYLIDEVHVTLRVPFGKQDGLSLGMESRGTVIEETYDAAGHLSSSRSSAFSSTFVMRRATGDRWLNVAVLPSTGG